MDLHAIRNELQRLTDLVDGWSVFEDIPALERDLVLEKLRTLYDAVRFGEGSDAREAEPTEVPVGIGLDEFAPFAPLVGAETELDAAGGETVAVGPEAVGSLPPSDAEVFGEAESAFVPETDPIRSEILAPDGIADETELPGFPDDGPDDTAFEAGEQDVVREMSPMVGYASEPFAPVENPASETNSVHPDTGAEPRREVAADAAAGEDEGIAASAGMASMAAGASRAGAQTAEDLPQSALPEQGPAVSSAEASGENVPDDGAAISIFGTIAEETVPESGMSEEVPGEKVAGSISGDGARGEGAPDGKDSGEGGEPPLSETGSASSEKEVPHSVMPTLFGPEEPVRHRHRQRVIMSLYDAPRPAVSERGHKPSESGVQAEAPADERRADGATAVREVVGAVPAGDSVRVPGLDRAKGTDGTEPSAGMAAAYAERTSLLPDESVSEAAPEVVEPVREEEEEPRLGSEMAPAAGAVLGEVINRGVQTLADTISPPRDVASELRRSEPVVDLRRAVGINDRFLMIRDLFDGDEEAYERAMETFDGFGDLDDCMIHIAENYVWNPNSDGAKLMMELLERKFES